MLYSFPTDLYCNYLFKIFLVEKTHSTLGYKNYPVYKNKNLFWPKFNFFCSLKYSVFFTKFAPSKTKFTVGFRGNSGDDLF
jgi:hypothetical protein